MFCPKCHSIMFMKDGEFQCRKCGISKVPGISDAVATSREKAETVILEKEISTLPTAKVECPACQNNEAYWILRQTRASDEPETRIYTCKECGNKWREY